MTKPFRFGIMTAGEPTAAALREKARRVESLGYSSLLFNDHYAGPGPAMASANHGAQPVAAIPAAVLAAEATSTLTIGFRVIGIDYHHPVVLAKSLATIDLFSEGRLEIGLGAGWIAAEYDAMGIPFDKPSVRIARLAEAIDLIRQHMGEGQIDVRGDHVKVHGFEGIPKPVQRPCPPIAVGGGNRKILEMAARKADIVTFNVNNRTGKLGADNFRESSAAHTAALVDVVKTAAGDRFGDLELETGAFRNAITDDRMAAAAEIGGSFGLSAEEMLEHPHGLIGTIDQICDTIEERRERYGFSSIVVHDEVSFAPVVERLAGK